MPKKRIKFNNKVVYTFITATAILVGTYFAIRYAQGNFRITEQGFTPETGLLSANSFPTGAQVIINGKLSTATDDTLYLEPGTYEVEIIKDGYSSWKKSLEIEKGLVRQTNALLFPSAPSLTPLTFTGVKNVSPSPDGQKLLYYTSSASVQAKNGLYLMELSSNLNFLQRGPRQLTEDNANYDLANAKFIWSPDSTEIMIIDESHEVIIGSDKKTDLSALPDIRLRRKQILSQWEEEMYIREREFLGKFPPEIIKIATASAKNAYISPDKKRIMYTATAEITIPENIVPAIPSSNTQPEKRNLEAGEIYIYDREEDKNFYLGKESEIKMPQLSLFRFDHENAVATESGSTVEDDSLLNDGKNLLATDLDQNRAITLAASPSAFLRLQASDSAQTILNFNRYHSSIYTNTFQWFPNSKHVVFSAGDRVVIKEYDNSNHTTLYSGPFAEDFIYPWPDGNRIIILTSFSPDSPLNLYAIELK